jgi:hypothetical protein
MHELVFEWMAPVKVVYVDDLGKTSVRTIRPRALKFETTARHREPQWILEAFDPGSDETCYLELKNLRPLS